MSKVKDCIIQRVNQKAVLYKGKIRWYYTKDKIEDSMSISYKTVL